MIDDFNANHTGWARFSDDRTLRYRLARSLTWRGGFHGITQQVVSHGLGRCSCASCVESPLVRVVFVMLNPSTADAFKLDPTISKCVQFAQRWGADVLEVVNLFALRSTDPRALDDISIDDIGDGPDNDAEILAACTGASRVIAAWGNHGAHDGRGERVREMLQQAGITLEHLGVTKEGFPLHPLARGKAWIPLTREPEVWAP